MSRRGNSSRRLDDCRLIDVPTFADTRGALSVVEGGKELPFVPQRAFWISGMPENSRRGQHAHRGTDEAIICLQGSMCATLNDGVDSREFVLDNSRTALYLAPMVWIDMHHFSPDALVLALASSQFSEADYFREWDGFMAAVGKLGS